MELACVRRDGSLWNLLQRAGRGSSSPQVGWDLGHVLVPLGTRRVNTSVVWDSLCAAWQGIVTILNGRARASVARTASCGEPRAGKADAKRRTGSIPQDAARQAREAGLLEVADPRCAAAVATHVMR